MRTGSSEIAVDVPATDVWAALVAPGLREWYYGLTPEGAFDSGSTVRWVDRAGRLAEEWEIVELAAPRHLVVRAHFTFAPNLAALEPHRLDWHVEGGRVRLVWDGPDAVAALFESEAHAQLRSLRLAVDPAARAEIARLEAIGDVTVRDVTADLVADYQDFFDHEAFRDYPSWQSCYCMETHRTQSDEEWALRTGEENRRDMSDMISSGKVTALLAYADGEPVGWCNYGETTRLAGVMHRFGLEASDHEGVGSIACFVISSRYRGHGVATRLLDAAVDRLRAKGLRAVEAYPGREGNSAQSHYRGPLSMFLRVGFEPYREAERYVVVRKAL